MHILFDFIEYIYIHSDAQVIFINIIHYFNLTFTNFSNTIYDFSNVIIDFINAIHHIINTILDFNNDIFNY